jgi:hypothetical protein
MTRRQCWLAGAAALTGLLISMPGEVDAQSLVEVARLAQLARSRTAGPVRTYTQEDFPPSDRLASRRQPRRAIDARYRALLDAALKRERDLERRLRETRATRTQSAAPARNVLDEPKTRLDETHGGGGTEGGIPLAIAYGSAPGPLFYLGQPVRRSPSPQRGLYGRRGHGRGRARSDGSVASSQDHSPVVPRSAPARRAPARNGYAESSRPMHYVAPGIPAPGIRSRSMPRGR